MVQSPCVEGAVLAIERVLKSRAWRSLAADIEVEFAKFEDFAISADSADEQVWRACQDAGAILVTGNRAADQDGLDSVIRRLGQPDSLPVITIADAKRAVRDRIYTTEAALSLLHHLEHIDSLRGTGRLYVP